MRIIFIFLIMALGLNAQPRIESLVIKANDKSQLLEIEVSNWSDFHYKPWIGTVTVTDAQDRLLYQQTDTSNSFSPDWKIPYSYLDLPEGKQDIRLKTEIYYPKNPEKKAQKTGKATILKQYKTECIAIEESRKLRLELVNWDNSPRTLQPYSIEITLLNAQQQAVYQQTINQKGKALIEIPYYQIQLPSGHHSLTAQVQARFAGHQNSLSKRVALTFQQRLPQASFWHDAQNNRYFFNPEGLDDCRQPWEATAWLTDKEGLPIYYDGWQSDIPLNGQKAAELSVTKLEIANGHHDLTLHSRVVLYAADKTVERIFESSQAFPIEKKTEYWIWQTQEVKLENPQSSDISFPFNTTNLPDYYWILEGGGRRIRHTKQEELFVALQRGEEWRFSVWDADLLFDDLEGEGTSQQFRTAAEQQKPVRIDLYHKKKYVGYVQARVEALDCELFNDRVDTKLRNYPSIGHCVEVDWIWKRQGIDSVAIKAWVKRRNALVPYTFWVDQQPYRHYCLRNEENHVLFSIPIWHWQGEEPILLEAQGYRQGQRVHRVVLDHRHLKQATAGEPATDIAAPQLSSPRLYRQDGQAYWQLDVEWAANFPSAWLPDSSEWRVQAQFEGNSYDLGKIELAPFSQKGVLQLPLLGSGYPKSAFSMKVSLQLQLHAQGQSQTVAESQQTLEVTYPTLRRHTLHISDLKLKTKAKTLTCRVETADGTVILSRDVPARRAQNDEWEILKIEEETLFLVVLEGEQERIRQTLRPRSAGDAYDICEQGKERAEWRLTKK